MQEEIITPHLLKMSLSCSRCKNLICLNCHDESMIIIKCKFKSMHDQYQAILKQTRGCPDYEEDLDILRAVLI